MHCMGMWSLNAFSPVLPSALLSNSFKLLPSVDQLLTTSPKWSELAIQGISDADVICPGFGEPGARICLLINLEGSVHLTIEY